MKSIYLSFIVGLAILAGCATPQLPPELIYVPPSSGAHAVITGSDAKPPVFISDTKTAFVFAVDGKRVAAERAGWKVPLFIATGSREIEAMFQQGAYVGKAKFTLNAEEGHKYEVRAETDGKYDRQSADLWIVDLGTGKAVTEAERVFFRRGGGGMVPIFIPVK